MSTRKNTGNWTAMRRTSAPFKGVVCVAALALLLVGLGLKTLIVTAARSGETIHAEFSTDYNLRDNKTRVKMAGLEVGVVTGIEHTDEGTTIVAMKVDEEALEDLGPQPEAQIDPVTVLGGQVTVNLVSGGGQGHYDGADIPLSRTSVPTELDKILEALPADTRAALQGSTANLAHALRPQGTRAILRLALDARQPFSDAGVVFQAANGRDNEQDLQGLVADVHSIGSVLAGRTSKVDDAITNLDLVTRALSRQRGPIGNTVHRLPQALRASSQGLAALHLTLDKLGVAADRLRPTARAAAPLVQALDRALPQLGPLLSDLKPTLRDARPVVAKLIPVSDRTTTALGYLHGPVLTRVNERILPMLGRPWRGSGPYADSGRGVQANNRFYEEIGYMVTNLDRASMVQDAQGSLLNFAVGVGLGSAQPVTLEEMLLALAQRVTGGGR